MLATKNFLKRNRTNFAIGASIIGSVYVATQYVFGKLTDTRERLAIDRIAKENLRRRFEQNQEDCSFTVLALLPTATERILEVLPVEQITHQLQEKKAARLAKSNAPSEVSMGAPSIKDDDAQSVKSFISDTRSRAGEDGKPKKSKAQLWNELKLTSITRAYTLVYTLALLCFLTRIQLNLLGRKNYLSSVVSLAERDNESTISLENYDSSPTVTSLDFDINRKYLTFSWWLLHRGWRKLLTVVEVAVKQVFGPLNPRDDISMAQLRDLTMQIRKTVEGDEEFGTSWLPFLLPPHGEEDLVLSEAGVLKPENNDEKNIDVSQPTIDDLNVPSSYPDPSFIPPPSQEPTPTSSANSTFATSQTLRHLLDETSDLIDSPPGRSVVNQMLDAGFAVLIEEKLAEQAFKIIPTHPPRPSSRRQQREDDEQREEEAERANRIQEVEDGENGEIAAIMTKVANVLAVMTRQAHLIGNGIPNEYLKAMEKQQDLTGFSAIIYSNFDLARSPPS